jgi:hypothetical protein
VFSQITRTTPLRRTTLHFVQIFLTEALTFIGKSLAKSIAKRTVPYTVRLLISQAKSAMPG